MPIPDHDGRTRNKISLKPSTVLSTSIPKRLIPYLLSSNVLYVLALQLSKEWLLDFDVGILWVVMRVLACGGLGALIWESRTGQLAKRNTFEWSVLGTASLLLFVQQVCLFTALHRLSSIRVILFSHFSTLWLGSLVSLGSTKKTSAVLSAMVFCVISDTRFSAAAFWHYLPGYAALVLHALSSAALKHTFGLLYPSLGSTFTTAIVTVGACIFCLPFYVFRSVVLGFPTGPVLSLVSLGSIPFVSFSLLYFVPISSQSLGHLFHTRQQFVLSYPVIAASSAIFGALAFTSLPTWTDLIVAILLYVGMYPENVDAFKGVPRTPTSRLIRSYIKTILSNPESRKIFYFLMLNLCYMLVQMLYGVWTNSLGLISDAIHMAFDCMAIGVGLFASVMATWEPNERFTYGYGRIETLSGFANGIFLILISIFIVFEAIQRILDPPEMNTSQLLLVSSLGLAVNLFGMFAMGGHHHHHHGGHSHSHSHGETHSHEHSHGHSHSHHDHEHDCNNHSEVHNSDHHLHLHNHSDQNIMNNHSAHDCDHSHHPHEHDHTHTHDHTHSTSPHQHGHSHPNNDHHHHHHNSESPTLETPSFARSHIHSSQIHGHSHSHSNVTLPVGHSAPQPFPHAHNRTQSFSVNALHPQNTQHLVPPTPPPRHVRSMSTNTIMDRQAVDNVRHQLHGQQHTNRAGLSPIVMHPPDDLSNNTEAESPLTPGYSFVHDKHLEKHHHQPHHHSHSHSHEGHSHNMRGVFLHVMADTLGSVGVIISTLLIQFYGWTGFDPIASLFIAILIAASVFPLVIDTGKVLCLDVGDRDEVIQKTLGELQSIPGVQSYSDPRFWPKDSASLVGSVHIRITPSTATHDPAGPHSNERTTYVRVARVVERVRSLLTERISGLEEVTVQVTGGSVML